MNFVSRIPNPSMLIATPTLLGRDMEILASQIFARRYSAHGILGGSAPVISCKLSYQPTKRNVQTFRGCVLNRYDRRHQRDMYISARVG